LKRLFENEKFNHGTSYIKLGNIYYLFIF